MTEELLERVHAWRDLEDFTAAELAALEFAERFVVQPDRLDATAVDILRGHLADDEIVDLVLCVAKYLAIGRVVKVLELDHTCPVPAVASKGESSP